tara:strand:- start:41 stop:763 length:723 start_codon:yes stop_codon:yes gene_type:complete
MAIKDIDKMIAPLSRRDDVLEKLRANDPDKELRDKGILPPLQKYASEMAMSDAPEDFLKRAVEQFIIDFPEFEDLQGQDLYDKMEEKGYFSDRYAMSDPHPMEGYDDMLEKGALEIFGKPLRSLTNDQYEELEERIRDMLDADIPYAAKGGIIGLRFGGDPKLEQELEQIHNPAENGQQGIMQLASGLDIQALSLDELQLKIDALNWAMKYLGRNSWAEVLEDSDMQGVLNAYQDAGGMD